MTQANPHHRRLLVILLLALSPTLCALSGTTRAQALAPAANQHAAILVSPSSGSFYTPNETFHLQLPKVLRNQKLTLELNDIDVSAFAKRTETGLTFKPIGPLPTGHSTLRLVEFKKDGSVIEWGFWQVEIRHSARFRETSLQGGLDATLSQRVAESSNIRSTDAFSVQASGAYNAVLETKTWRSEAAWNLMVSDDPALSLTGKKADIPSFFVKNTHGNLTVNVGDHVIASPDLLNDGYQKRGLSSSVAMPGLKTSMDVFSVGSNQHVGIDDGLGISDSDNRTNGTRLSYQPINSELAHIVLSSSFVTGKQSGLSFGSFTDPNLTSPLVYQGDAWNTTIDSNFFERLLRFRYEFAKSQYDFDGIENGQAASKDEAWSSLLIFNALAKNEGDLGLNIGIEKKRVGTLFKSIANAQLPADKELQSLFLNGKRKQWHWNASVSKENNNLDNNLFFAKTNTQQWAIAGSFQQYQQAKKGNLLSLLGTPAINWSTTGVSIRDEYTPAGYLENNLTTRSDNINAVFTQKMWNWSLSLNRNAFNDHTDWQPQTETNNIGFNSSMQLGKRAYIALGWQLEKTRYVDEYVNTHRQYYSLEARATLIPHRLFGNISYGINQNHALDDPYYALKDKSTFVSGDLSWQVKKPKPNRLGINLSLAFQYNAIDDFISSINNYSENQIFLKLITVLPTQLPGAQL